MKLSLFVPQALPRCWKPEWSGRAYWGITLAGTHLESLQKALEELFPDQVNLTEDKASTCWVRAFRPGVSNPRALSLLRALGNPENVTSLRVDEILVWKGSQKPSSEVKQQLDWLWKEPAIENLSEMKLEAWISSQAQEDAPLGLREEISWEVAEPESWGLEFEPEEKRVLQEEAQQRGRPWNRAEWELFAQTWSEHCKHKIFQAKIRTQDTVHEFTDSLFKTHIRQPTLEIQERRPDRYLSVFHDNAGVVALDDVEGKSTEWAFCLKMETHNSPSAISPYGGASTGLVGVHRDILGTGQGALPIANWDVLCFEDPAAIEPRPAAALPPEVVRKGVLKGIEDGGNQSGIPTVQGSVLFDASFAVKPLVYCGSVGLLPKKRVHKKPEPGLVLYCIGGATGADGLRGAVMSSRDLRQEDFLGSAVQVANPFVQRCLTDFLMEARDRELVSVVTDNGAGGLASSVGEMAQLTGGASIDLSHLRLKFEGLLGWERLLSESQERMTVATAHPEAFEALARLWRVDFDRLGALTEDGYFRVLYREKPLVEVRLEFLHEGCPRLEMKSAWTAGHEVEIQKTESALKPQQVPQVQDFAQMLASPHLCAREDICRAFDHEVQGRSLRKPWVGTSQESPQDASWIHVPEAGRAGVVLAHGLAPQREDIVENVFYAFDEALRAVLLAGARWESLAALDNFCWPDPIPREGARLEHQERRLWRLVRACEVLSDLCRTWEIPLVSGKDSMKNNNRDFAARETLVVSLAASAEDLSSTAASFFTRANDVVVWLPPYGLSLRDSAWERVFHARAEGMRSTLFSEELQKHPHALQLELKKLALNLKNRYERVQQALRRGWIRSARDISEGGLLTALFEMSLGREVGVFWESPMSEPLEAFGEGLGGYVWALDPHVMREMQELFPEMRRVGVTWRQPCLRGNSGISWELSELRAAYQGPQQKGFWR